MSHFVMASFDTFTFFFLSFLSLFEDAPFLMVARMFGSVQKDGFGGGPKKPPSENLV